MSRPKTLYGQPWTTEEYILALDLYFRIQGRPMHAGAPEVVALAGLIGRTPAAVNMRLENYASVDPRKSHRAALKNISAQVRKTFEKYNDRRAQLEGIAGYLADERARPGPRQFDLFGAEPSRVKVPRALGRYELFDEVGIGGYAKVYSCVDTSDDSGTLLAIKIIKLDGAGGDPEHVRRFLREIRLLRQIRHPNVIRLVDDNLDAEREFPALVMELGEQSLTQFLDKAEEHPDVLPALPTAESESVVESVLLATEAIHSAERVVVHRDINPNNILRMSDGRWVLSDFGLSKPFGGHTETKVFSTRMSAVGGTEQYAAPEQWKSLSSADQRADIHAVGVLIWRLFTSCQEPIRHDQLGLPPALEELVRKATQVEPDRRYQSAAELLAAFRGARDLAFA